MSNNDIKATANPSFHSLQQNSSQPSTAQYSQEPNPTTTATTVARSEIRRLLNLLDLLKSRADELCHRIDMLEEREKRNAHLLEAVSGLALDMALNTGNVEVCFPPC